jgi:hypothetical protein
VKKFILGLSLGLLIACSSVVFASNSIQALLFPASFEINGSNVTLNSDYKVLNVDGHAYVPIRFVAENLGGTIDYDAESKKVIIKNRELDLTDPDYKGIPVGNLDYKGISVGNLILTKVNGNTKVTGQLVIKGVGNTKYAVAATLSFYNDNSKKIGEVVIKGTDFGVEPQMFTLEDSGDFRAYSTVNLHIDSVNNQTIKKSETIAYINTKHKFSLSLPKSWEGKYEVVESANSISFIDIANNRAGIGGYLFTIEVWTKEKWETDKLTLQGIIPIVKIGERGNEIFTLSTPTDVNYIPSDEALSAEYAAMWKYVGTIKTTFKLS